MNEVEAREKFNKNVLWLKSHIPENDIYNFAEQALMGAEFFMQKWAHLTDAPKEMEQCSKTDKWVKNVFSIRQAKVDEIKNQISTKMSMS